MTFFVGFSVATNTLGFMLVEVIERNKMQKLEQFVTQLEIISGARVQAMRGDSILIDIIAHIQEKLNSAETN